MSIDLGEKRRRRKNERNAAMYDDEVFELLQAIDSWRRKNDRSFPAWSEVLQILKSLGWRKVADAGPLPETTALPEVVDEPPADPGIARLDLDDDEDENRPVAPLTTGRPLGERKPRKR
jgi:hypothetical protein